MSQITEEYAAHILAMWLEVIPLAEDLRLSELEARMDGKKINRMIAKLTRLWLELEPKVKGISEKGSNLKDLEDTFMSFRDCYFEPTKLLEEMSRIYQMEESLRMVIEKVIIEGIA